MKTSSLRLTLGAVSSSAFAAAAIACASDATVDPPPPPPLDSSVAPPVDAGSSDAPLDRADVVDASTDALLRACSLDDFCPTPLPPDQTIRGLWGDGLGVVWAVTQQGKVLRWDGRSWSIAHSVVGRLLAIWGSGPTDLWIGGDVGLVHGRGPTSDAIVWEDVAIPGVPSAAIRSIWGPDPSHVWAVGRSEPPAEPATRVVRMDVASAEGAWSLDPLSSRPFGFLQVFGTKKEVWLVADSRPEAFVTVLRARDGGEWTQVPLLPPTMGATLETAMSGAMTTADDVWIFGKNGGGELAAWRGTRGEGDGFVWKGETEQFVRKSVWGIWGTSSTDAWSAGEYGRARHWDGAKWTQARITLTAVPFTKDFYATWGDGKGELWFAGDGVAIRRGPNP